jgi:glycosyltransferase involved in cell wall biosynthesis
MGSLSTIAAVRVLLVNDLPPGPGGGAEVYVSRLAAGLEAAGDAVQLFTSSGPRRGASRVLDVWDPIARRRLRDTVRQFRPDVVHYHNVLRELSVSVLGAAGHVSAGHVSAGHVPAGHVPAVLTVHDLRLLGAADPDTGAARWLKTAKAGVDRAIARRSIDLAVGASPPVAARLRAAGFRRVAHVPIFAPPPPAGLPVPPVTASRRVVYAGRLAEDKGVMVLADAFRRLVAAPGAGDCGVTFVGDGPQRPRLEAVAREYGPGTVVVTGALDERGVREVMATARVVVRPSLPALRPEGASLTVVEAALLGRPVVVSDDPANRELVDASHCGIVVPAGSSEALADAIRRLIVDGELALSMGEAGRAYAMRHHTVAAATSRYRALYHELLDH